MEKSMLKRSQISCIPNISLDHKNCYTCIKPISSLGSCGYGANDNFKRSSLNLHLHSVLKSSVFAAGKTNKRDLLWVHLIRATSSSDKGEDGKQNKASDLGVFSLFAAIIGGLIKILDVISGEKKALQNIEEKVENTVQIVEKVADTAKDVAKKTEEIAEQVEKQSKEGGILSETAETVDEISKRVVTDADIVEKEAEKIKEGIKIINEKVDKTEDAIKEIAEVISGPADKEQKNG